MINGRWSVYILLILVSLAFLWVWCYAEENNTGMGKTENLVEKPGTVTAGGEKGEREKKRAEKEKERGVPLFVYDEKTGHYSLDASRYHAEFSPHEMVFMLKMKSGTGKPIVFKTEGFFQGEERLFSGAGDDAPETSVIEDNRILMFKWKDYTEEYVVERYGFNQRWTIKTPVKNDKDIVLKAVVSTEYQLEPKGEEGFLIKDGERIIVNFKQLTAIDVTGKKSNLKTELKGKYLEVTIPKDYLKEAQFPVTINPPQKPTDRNVLRSLKP